MSEEDNGTIEIGAPVSAKYRGAWCEGKVKTASYCVQFKVTFVHDPSKQITLEQGQVRGGSKIGERVEAQNPSTKKFAPADIVRVVDKSTYLIRFNDGDERRLRRRAVTRKGPMHFERSENLDNFPIVDPKKLISPSHRRRRSSLVASSEESDSDDDADEEEDRLSERNMNPSGTHHDVVLVDAGTVPFWPAMVVPFEEVVSSMCGDEQVDAAKFFVVRFFADNSFGLVEQERVYLFNRGATPFTEQLHLQAFQMDLGVHRALHFVDHHELPQGFEWPSFQPSDEEDQSDSDESESSGESDDDWVPDPVEEKKFYDGLIQHHAKLGTVFKRHPVLGFRDLNLFRLFKTVEAKGGYTMVTKQKGWRAIYDEMGFEARATGANAIRSSFEKHLLPFLRASNPHMKFEDVKEESEEEQVNDSAFRFQIGDIVTTKASNKAYHGRIEDREIVTEADLDDEDDEAGPQYLIHYIGWGKRFDEWLPESKIKKSAGPPPKRVVKKIKAKRPRFEYTSSSSDDNDGVGDSQADEEVMATTPAAASSPPSTALQAPTPPPSPPDAPPNPSPTRSPPATRLSMDNPLPSDDPLQQEKNDEKRDLDEETSERRREEKEERKARSRGRKRSHKRDEAESLEFDSTGPADFGNDLPEVFQGDDSLISREEGGGDLPTSELGDDGNEQASYPKRRGRKPKHPRPEVEEEDNDLDDEPNFGVASRLRRISVPSTPNPGRPEGFGEAEYFGSLEQLQAGSQDKADEPSSKKKGRWANHTSKAKLKAMRATTSFMDDAPNDGMGDRKRRSKAKLDANETSDEKSLSPGYFRCYSPFCMRYSVPIGSCYSPACLKMASSPDDFRRRKVPFVSVTEINAQKYLDTLPVADQIDFIRKRLELHGKILRKLERKRRRRDDCYEEDPDPKRAPVFY